MSSESSSCAQNKRARARDFSYGLWGGVEDMFLMCETTYRDMEYVQKIQVLSIFLTFFSHSYNLV